MARALTASLWVGVRACRMNIAYSAHWRDPRHFDLRAGRPPLYSDARLATSVHRTPRRGGERGQPRGERRTHVPTKIVFCPPISKTIMDVARGMVPDGYELDVLDRDDPRFPEAMKEAEY